MDSYIPKKNNDSKKNINSSRVQQKLHKSANILIDNRSKTIVQRLIDPREQPQVVEYFKLKARSMGVDIQAEGVPAILANAIQKYDTMHEALPFIDEQLQLHIESKAGPARLLNTNYNSIKSGFPIVEQVEGLASVAPSLDGSNVASVLKMAVILYANANLIAEMVSDADNGPDKLAELVAGMDKQRWAERNILQSSRFDMYGNDPEQLAVYFKFVLGFVMERWPLLDLQGKIQLVNRVFNHSKGYDSSFEDIMSLQQMELLGVDDESGGASAIISEWLQKISNTNIFTGISLGVNTGGSAGKVRTQIENHYSEATQSEKKYFWTQVVAALIAADKGSWSTIQDFLTRENILQIKSALGSVAGGSPAADAEDYLSDITELF